MSETNRNDDPQHAVVMRAFKTFACDIESIVFAETRGKACYATFLAATDVGYRIKFTDIKVNRAKQYDLRKYKNGGIATTMCCHNKDNLIAE